MRAQVGGELACGTEIFEGACLRVKGLQDDMGAGRVGQVCDQPGGVPVAALLALVTGFVAPGRCTGRPGDCRPALLKRPLCIDLT